MSAQIKMILAQKVDDKLLSLSFYSLSLHSSDVKNNNRRVTRTQLAHGNF